MVCSIPEAPKWIQKNREGGDPAPLVMLSYWSGQYAAEPTAAAPGRRDRRPGSARRHEQCGKHREDERTEDAGPGQRGLLPVWGDPDGDRRQPLSESLRVPVSRRPHGRNRPRCTATLAG